MPTIDSLKIPGGSTLAELLPRAQQAGYALPAFSTRYRACIRPAVEAAKELRSPVIIEISQRELGWFELTPRQFRDELERVVRDVKPEVPFALHLDHSWELDVIEAAIAAGFTSVMIDASAKPLDENIATTRQVVDMAHARGVSVEAELGRLTTTDKMETDYDDEMYTDPAEAEEFVRRTACDALAVSIGTAHGVYPVKNPTIDFARLAEIRRRIPQTPLVLHGGSGLPTETVHRAIALPGGGVSKMNIATDLEQALLAAMGGTGKPLERMTSAALDAYDASVRARGLAAVKQVAAEKIRDFVLSAGRA
jgi:ketose-bisphosphate aldolase